MCCSFHNIEQNNFIFASEKNDFSSCKRQFVFLSFSMASQHLLLHGEERFLLRPYSLTLLIFIHFTMLPCVAREFANCFAKMFMLGDVKDRTFSKGIEIVKGTMLIEA